MPQDVTLPPSPGAKTAVDETLIRELVRPGPRYTSYPTAPVWTTDVDADCYAKHLQVADQRADEPLSLYVHLPFCREMCNYCGCNVVVTNRAEKVDRYIAYLAREMTLVGKQLHNRRTVSQLHLGGGTPTLLSPAQLRALWQEITYRFQIAPGADLALEADPRVTSREQLALLRELGFSRLSLGVQDFTPEVQRAIGRLQTVEQTTRLYEQARELGYRPLNLDLVYGLPAQQPASLDQTLRQVIAMRPDRLALFSYAHVPWMRPHQKRIDERLLPDPVRKMRLFEQARDTLTAAGYQQIGMDHFALDSDELAQARHHRTLRRNFQGYTTRPADDTLAFGITAIGDLAGAYFQNVKHIAEYRDHLEQGRLPTERGWALTVEDKLRREVIHGIMCNFYIDLAVVSQRSGFPADFFAEEVASLEWAERWGLLHRRGHALEVTTSGQLFLRNIAMVFDAYLPSKPKGPTFSSTV